MSTAWIPLARSCNQACRFCAVSKRLDGTKLGWEHVLSEIEKARAAGATEIVFTGGEPTLSAQLVRALATARGLGLRTGLSTNGRLLKDLDKVGRLQAVGVDAIAIALHAVTPSVHNALVGGDPIAHEQTLRALTLCAPRFATTLRTVLTRANAHELPALLDLAARLGVAFDLRLPLPAGAARDAWAELGLPDDEALDLLHAARTQARALGVRFSAWGYPTTHRTDRPSPANGAPLDEDVRWLLRRGVATRAMLGGLLAPSTERWVELATRSQLPPDELPLELAVRHLPVLDLPADVGGVGLLRDGGALSPAGLPGAWTVLLRPDAHTPLAWRPAAPGAIHLLDGALDDPWLGLHTLPALAEALRTLGAEVVHHRLWTAPFSADQLDPPEPSGVLSRVGTGLRRALSRPDPSPRLPHPERPGPDATATRERWLRDLDLTGASVVVLGSHADAERVRQHPTFPKTARLEILESRLLAGYRGGLGPTDVVRTPWPAQRKLYSAAGISARHLHFRPTPVHLPHLAAARPAHACDEVLLIGGAGLDSALASKVLNQRDLRLRTIEAPQLGAEVGPGWRERISALLQARFVWWPQRDRRAMPADTRWLSLALAAGRPVLAAELPGVAHHVWPEHDGLLVGPGDVHGACAAIDRLRDEQTARTLEAGALHRREVVSVQRWAEELVHGAPAHRVVPRAPGLGPWTCW